MIGDLLGHAGHVAFAADEVSRRAALVGERAVLVAQLDAVADATDLPGALLVAIARCTPPARWRSARSGAQRRRASCPRRDGSLRLRLALPSAHVEPTDDLHRGVRRAPARVVSAAPTVFLSHAHEDKRVARRLVRRLTAHGVDVWIDERELRFGARLTKSLCEQIERADVLLVVASEAAAASDWVPLELSAALDSGTAVVPFLIEPVAKLELFRDHLGVDATSPQRFADAVHTFMRDLFLSQDRETPPADPATLTAGLRQLVAEEPALRPFLLACLEDGHDWHYDTGELVFEAAFHDLDFALSAVFDRAPVQDNAHHAAFGFRNAGAGTRALRSWIEATGDGELVLVFALGERLAPELIDTAIGLLRSCEPPNDHALYQFIDRNAEQLDDKQRQDVIGLIIWPLRHADGRHAVTLGWVALKHFPEAMEIRNVWTRWVDAGGFDKKAHDLARTLARMHDERVPGANYIGEALQRRVREQLRSADEKNVWLALNQIRAATDAKAPVLGSLLREARGVSGTHEWRQWEVRDRAAFERMESYVTEFANEAAGGGDWYRATTNAKQEIENKAELRRLLAENRKP